MILTEAEQTGETGSDSDGDGIPYIAGGTKPFVFAASETYDFTTGITLEKANDISINVFPNPANEFVSIQFNLDKHAEVTISIFDINGKLIPTQIHNNLVNGLQEITIPLNSINTGNYFIRTSINNDVNAIEKLIIIK